MEPILAGIETEYGLHVEGRGAEDQVEDSMALVRSYPGECFPSWDYRYESPRADLRGFTVDRLQIDPEDSRFDAGRDRQPGREARADRILSNGARFYNDHGHPEYATPECWGDYDLALHDRAGEAVVLAAARALERAAGRRIRIYKNNTDYHGASYGTHESYLVPRSLGFRSLYEAVLPMLVARQILCGSGKVGSETGQSCTFQLSQRADFFVEACGIDTLFRRPIFNTRDEPHAEPSDWMRLHVICGDANMMSAATARKVGLVKLAIQLALAGRAPIWRLENPVKAFQSISRDESYGFEIQLEGRSWATAYQLLESYFAVAEALYGLKAPQATYSPGREMQALIAECRMLMVDLRECPERFAALVDWAAKKAMIERYLEDQGADWRDGILRSFDLEYHNIDPEEGLFYALEGQSRPDTPSLLECVTGTTRAFPRGLAITRFQERLVTACWRSLTFEIGGETVEVDLPPNREYSPELSGASNVEDFIEMLRGVE